MILRLLDEAREEMRESARWYDNQRKGLGSEFLDAIERALELIEEHPNRSTKVATRYEDRDVRRNVVKRFPFVIVYEILQTEVLVVAIAHTKRRPKYWESRLS